MLLLCSFIVVGTIYRKWKIEMEIEGLLWRIDIGDLIDFVGGCGKNIASSAKVCEHFCLTKSWSIVLARSHVIVSFVFQVSIISALSYESRGFNQVFAQTSTYKNKVIRIKELKFNKKRDVSRESMKEMRLLRELRHDNVNSFIGAAIDLYRIVLVTDYCSKGSLYVSRWFLGRPLDIFPRFAIY